MGCHPQEVAIYEERKIWYLFVKAGRYKVYRKKRKHFVLIIIIVYYAPR
jgi:hypothetical protein